jgi:hypothetical protein
MSHLFINKIDHLRKLGDFIACIIFLLLAIYLYRLKYYKTAIFILICSIFDMIFTYDAIKTHGFYNIINIIYSS